MNNFSISFVFLIVIILLLITGYSIVPGVKVDGELSKEFAFSGYMALLSFLATAAVIGPLTAQFVKYRSDKEWREARINACSRLNNAITQFFNNYTMFIKSCSDDEHNIAPMHFDSTIKSIEEFMDIYDDERMAFNPAMHSACSNVRRKLTGLLISMKTTKVFAHTDTSVRLQLHRHDLDKIRALFDFPRLKHAENKTPIEKHTFMNADEPIVIEEDPYFFEHDRLFIDGSIKVNRGTQTITKFSGINLSKIQSNWSQFLSACPKNHKIENIILSAECIILDEQKSSHADYLKRFVKEKYMLDMLLDDEYV